MTDLEKLKFPIGKWVRPSAFTDEDREQYITHIRLLPQKLFSLVEMWSDIQLDTPYREGGWTGKQVIHHIADSHMNSFIRFKWALTEDRPTIKPYLQDPWAALADANGPIEPSLRIIEGLHQRWVELANSFTTAEFERELIHPDWETPLSLDLMLSLYSWHGEHHYQQIYRLAIEKGWI